MITLAYIGIIALPPQFSYKPVAPTKRFTNMQTAGGTVLHTSPAIQDGDMLIPWSVKAATKAQYVQMLGYYTAYDVTDRPTERAFQGYWGDSYDVRFLIMDNPTVYANGLFDLSGSFHVTDVNSYVT